MATTAPEVLGKVHPCQGNSGRITDPEDLPEQPRAYASREPESLRQMARQLGEAPHVYADAPGSTKRCWSTCLARVRTRST